jgi:O-antigen/teichoic acid export membrane protein
LNESEDTPKGLRGTVIRGASLAGGGYALAQALNLGFYLALARLATPADFGQIAAASIFVGIGLLISDSGMMAALVHRDDRLEEAASTATAATFAAGIGLTALTLALSPLVGLFFQSAEIGRLTAALSGIMFFKAITAVPSALLQRRFSFVRRLVVEPASVVAFGTCAVVATSKGMGAWGLVIGQYGGAIADAGFSWAMVSWRPQLRLVSYRMWRELVSYGRHVLVATILLNVGSQADTLLLGRFIGSGPLGQYRYAFRLATTPYWMLLSAASYVLFPAFSRIAKDRDRFHGAFLRSLRMMALIAMPAGLILVPLGEPLAVILFGSEWREAGYAAMAMCLYCGASTLSSIVSEALKAAGKPNLLTRTHGLTTVLTAGLMIAMLPLGLEGIAGALSVGAAVSAAYAIWLAHRTLDISLRAMAAEIWAPLAAATVMAITILPLERLAVHAASHGIVMGAILLLAEALAALAVYAIGLRLLAPSTAMEAWKLVRGSRSRFRQLLRKAPSQASPPPLEGPNLQP